MLTPATTASSVSAPAFSISMALVQARRPLPLETTMFFGDAAFCAGAAAAAKAADPRMARRVIMRRTSSESLHRRECDRDFPGRAGVEQLNGTDVLGFTPVGEKDQSRLWQRAFAFRQRGLLDMLGHSPLQFDGHFDRRRRPV